jgi:hypothetical protein
MSELSDYFRKAHNNANADFLPLGGERAVNFNYILRTGDISPDGSSKTSYNNKTIDQNANDSFAQALKTIEQRTNEAVAADPACVKLLHKENWSKEDRKQWEEQVAKHAAEARYSIPGLQSYRSALTDGKENGLQHSGSLNKDLSADIDAARKNPNAKPTHELDCKDMTIIEGVAIQSAENHFLPKGDASGGYKQAMSYFFMAGGESDTAAKVGGHAFIYTPAGSIVEATFNPKISSPYLRSIADQPWESVFRTSKVAVNSYGGPAAVYGKWDSAENYEAARHVTQTAVPAVVSRAELMARNRVPGSQVLESEKDGLIMVASKTGQGPNERAEIKIYKEVNEGRPDQGYVLAGKKEAGRAPGQSTIDISETYTDTDKEVYKYHASFDDRRANLDISAYGITLAQSAPPAASPPKVEPVKPVTANPPHVAAAKPPVVPPSDDRYNLAIMKLAGAVTAIAKSQDKPAAAANVRQNIKTTQEGSGGTIKVPGEPDAPTRDAVGKLIAKVQQSPEYQAAMAASGGKIKADGRYGPQTEIALAVMAARGEISPDDVAAIKTLHRSGDLKYTQRDAPEPGEPSVKVTAKADKSDEIPVYTVALPDHLDLSAADNTTQVAAVSSAGPSAQSATPEEREVSDQPAAYSGAPEPGAGSRATGSYARTLGGPGFDPHQEFKTDALTPVFQAAATAVPSVEPTAQPAPAPDMKGQPPRLSFAA